MFPFLFGLVDFCFLPFLRRTSVQKWKKIWFCYVHKWIGKKEMSAKISKCLCRNLSIGAATQIRAVYKDHEILVTFKRCITLSFLFLDKFKQICYCFMLVVLTKTFFVYLTTMQIRPRLLIWKWNVRNVFVHHVNSECT